MTYDIVFIGSGPGGYVGAIRAAQLGFKTALIEKGELGGICLNWGCIPTKALLKSAQVHHHMSHADDYGLHIENPSFDWKKIVERSRNVAENMSKGVAYLLKKNNIDLIQGEASLLNPHTILIKQGEDTIEVESSRIVLATGARSRDLPHIKKDFKKIIGYRKAMTLEELPKSMAIIGSGAIGTEFAYLFKSFGVDVTLIEYLPTILPLEDQEIGKTLARSFKKMKMNILTSTEVTQVDTSKEGCHIHLKTKKGEEYIYADMVLLAVGVQANIEYIGLENLGIEIEQGKIKVDSTYQTNIAGIYAIGDIINTPALAHVASKEAIVCVESIAQLNPTPINYSNIASCIYTFPEVASIGLSEEKAISQQIPYKTGNFPFRASGKAAATGYRDGFIKILTDPTTDQIIGAHLIGENVTELIAEIALARQHHLSALDIAQTIHPHPTLSEGIMEAIEDAHQKAIHL